ncbi:MAG: type II toxin-antitoxin system Phd/YefM family antitoxin [Thermomicrobiales bacterium]|nr:type II toxin-antitoxin system Phd/YefM family antitoxin [Thermomicrobiales bacterium]
MKKTVTATEARVHFGELLRAVSEERATYVVERAGKPQAVILSSEEYQRLTDTQTPSGGVLDVYREAQRAFAPLVESGVFNDLEDVIRQERERRADYLDDILR